jgi:hypothetical protein
MASCYGSSPYDASTAKFAWITPVISDDLTVISSRAGRMTRLRITRQIAQKALLATVSLFLTLIGLEVGARVYLHFHRRVEPVDRWTYRSERPPAYQRAEYFGKDFLADSIACFCRRPQPANEIFVVPGEFSGKFIHVADGLRRTAFQPAEARQRLLLFGGSTIFSIEVPDSETIASHLQSLINAGGGPPLAVENYGVCSMDATQQTARLQTVAVHSGDIVVFYDGVNDVVYPVYSRPPAMPAQPKHQAVRKLNGLERGMHRAFVAFGDDSRLVGVLFGLQQRTLPHAVPDQQTLETNLADAEVGYAQALAAAQSYATQHGARFYHFLQPNIFTVAHPSTHERWLIENDLQSQPGLDRAFTLAYPHLDRAAARVCGDRNFDLSSVLGDASSRGEVFLDFCHVNHVANQIVASHIFRALFPSGSGQDAESEAVQTSWSTTEPAPDRVAR